MTPHVSVFAHENAIHPSSRNASTFAHPVTSPVTAFTRARQPPAGVRPPDAAHDVPTQIHPAFVLHAYPVNSPVGAIVTPYA
jgi:hypothetical protein